MGIVAGSTPRARFCSRDSHARHITVDAPVDDVIPSGPVNHLTLRSTGGRPAYITPAVHGTCVGTERLRRVPSGLRPVLCALACFRRNSSVKAPRWPYSGFFGSV